MRCWRVRAGLAMGAVLWLAGCASVPSGDEPREIRTASDQSDADRRAQVRLELAAAYFGRGQATTALDELKQALAAKPELPEAFSLRGLVYASLGEPRLAEESFLRALQLAPRDADIMQNYGWFLCQQKRFAPADEWFDRALAQPNYRDPVRSLLAKGVCLARNARLPEAEHSLSRAYELDPTNPFTAYSLSEVLYKRGELERARFYIRRINAQPEQSNAQTLWLAARIEHRLSNAQAAHDFGRRLRERFPQSTEALQYERGRFDEP